MKTIISNTGRAKNRLYKLISDLKKISSFEDKKKFLKRKNLIVNNEYKALFSIDNQGYKLDISIFEYAPTLIFLNNKQTTLSNKVFHCKIKSNQF